MECTAIFKFLVLVETDLGIGISGSRYVQFVVWSPVVCDIAPTAPSLGVCPSKAGSLTIAIVFFALMFASA